MYSMYCGSFLWLHTDKRFFLELLSCVVAAEGSKSVSAIVVMESIYNLVNNFFGCDECRTNFVNMYKSCSHDRCSTITSASSFKELEVPLLNT